MQNSDIEKGILMAASEKNFFLEIFLNGCFSRTAAKIFILEILITPVLHLVKDERVFMDYCLSEDFGEKSKHT